MALQVCSLVDGDYIAHSTDNDFTKPVLTIHDGSARTVIDKKLFLKRDNSSTYTLIQLTIASGDGDGWVVKCGDFGIITPTESDWEGAGDNFMFMDPESPSESLVLDTDSPIPFWIRIISPAGIPVQNKTNSSLTLSFKETA